MVTVPSTSASTQLGAILRRQEASDARAEHGLQDRGTTAERTAQIKQVQQSIDQNHGSKARQATLEALTHNKQIVNTPPPQRGSLVDIAA